MAGRSAVAIRAVAAVTSLRMPLQDPTTKASRLGISGVAAKRTGAREGPFNNHQH